MTTSAPHVIIVIMLHICAGHPRIHHNRILHCVYIVAVWSTAQYNATIDEFHQKPPETRDFNIPTVKFWKKQASSQQTTKDKPASHMPTGHIAKFTGSTGSYQPNNHNSQFSRGNQNYSSQHPAREQNCYDNNASSSFRNYGNQPRGPKQSHARFDEKYNQEYSPPIYPPTPSLNSSFPEALSKSLLQIAENQSRTTEVMKASQEAQAEAYKEMSRTNKMRDDDALFSSIEVYDGSNPTKFEKWINSIDQATHITGRGLRKELLKKSDGVIRNTLSMMDNRWSDNAIVMKLC